jgi:hypothetical protein
MNADPAVVESTSLSLKLRRNCTAGEASEPKVAVAMTHFGGTQGKVCVAMLVVVDTTLVAVWVVGVTVVAVVVVGMTSVTDVELVSVPAVPVTVMTVEPPDAPETTKVSTEVTLPPAGGVTGLVLKPPLTPDGSVGTARVTGELNPPTDCTIMAVVPVPPGLIVRVPGLADMVNPAPVVEVEEVVEVVVVETVNDAAAESLGPAFV